MIRIKKSANTPSILTTRGVSETNMLIYFYNINPKNYSSGLGVLSKNITKMHFDNTIYGDATVKAQLKIDQHNKCCFCESKFTDTSYGDVEHFRPKKAYKKNGAKSLTYPGYYW